MFTRLLLLMTLGICLWIPSMIPAGEPLTSAFTYQGRLNRSGQPFNGSANLVFRLYDNSTSGTLLGSQTLNAVTVSNGLFAVVLNAADELGVGAFNGERRWLAITVNGTTLSPRQEVAAVPYAAFAAKPWETSGSNISYNAGNVGIGTETPNAKLAVIAPSASSTENTATFYAPSIGSNASHVHWGPTGDWYIRSASSNGKVVLQDSGGAVGIGTTAPAFPLTVYTPIGYGLVHTDGAVEVGTFTNSSGGWLGTRSNHPLHFFANDSAPYVTLTPSGSVGIGTADPQATLHVYEPASVSHRIESGGGVNAWSKVEFANANGQWSVGTSRDFKGDQLYFHREGSASTAFALQPNGDASLEGNATQARDKGGWVKAMAYVNGDGTLIRSYNPYATTSAARGPFSSGSYVVNFGFQVNDRFISVSVEGGLPNTGANYQFSGTSAVEVYTFETTALSSLSDRPFMIIVY